MLRIFLIYMGDYVLLTNKGPIIMRDGPERQIKAIFLGVEYSFDTGGGLNARKDQKREERVKYIAEKCIGILQTRLFGKTGSKQKIDVEIELIEKSEKEDKIVPKKEANSLAETVLSGILGLLQSKLFGTSKKNSEVKKKQYTEGEFSTHAVTRKPKPIEVLKIVEVEEQEEIFDCRYSVVFEKIELETEQAEDSGLPKKEKDFQKERETSPEELRRFEQNFYLEETAFVLGLQRGKACVEEVGNWIYNREYVSIFGNITKVMEMHIAVFVNSVARSIPQDALGADVDEYIKCTEEREHAARYDYSKVLYIPENQRAARDRILNALQKSTDAHLIRKIIEKAALPSLLYFEEILEVLYSPEFVKYISTVEENIHSYKAQTHPEIAAAERKFRCNISFLFVDLYHRVIKYKMYTEEAQKILRKSAASTDTPNAQNAKSPKFQKEIEELGRLNRKMSTLLSATERCKNIKQLHKLGVALPNPIDDFIDMIELTDGFAIFTKEHLLIVNGNATVAVLNKKEVWGCVPCSEDFSTSYIDLAVSSLYPPVDNCVADVVGGTRVHWARLALKWDGYQEKFAAMFENRSAPVVPGLDISLTASSSPAEKEIRQRIPLQEVKKSHLRMLCIREQRKIVPSFGLYRYGMSEKLPEEDVFKIKSWVDTSLEKFSSSIGDTKDAKNPGFLDELASEAKSYVLTQKPASKCLFSEEYDEFSEALSGTQTTSASVSVYIEYLGYVLRCIEPKDRVLYSSSASAALASVAELKNPALSNDEFLDLVIGCKNPMEHPASISRNEFLLSLLVVRFFGISSACISKSLFVSICSPLFLFHWGALISLSQASR